MKRANGISFSGVQRGNVESAVEVLVIMRGPLEALPPSMNQVELLLRQGFRVGVLDSFHPEISAAAYSANGQLARIRPIRHILQHKEQLPKFWSRLQNALRFRRAVQNAVRTFCPRVIIACDMAGGWMLGRWWKRTDPPFVIWHFHEMPEWRRGGGLLNRLAYEFALRNVKRADLVVFPDQGRARIFSEMIEGSIQPVIVFNCPLSLPDLPTNRLRSELSARGWSGLRNAVCYSGALGPERGIETAIRSMPHWAAPWPFLLFGPFGESYRNSLTSLARDHGVSKRLIFWGSVSRAQLDELLVGCSVGLCVVENKTEINWRYNAGASNKRFDYMSLGLPQITNDGPGLKQLVDTCRCGFLVAPNDATGLNQVLNRLISDDQLRKEMGASARKAHLENFNYERQFQPVLEKIVHKCSAFPI